MPSRFFAILTVAVALFVNTGESLAQRLQTVFDTPESAMRDFGEAIVTKNLDAVRLILGDDYNEIIPPVSNADYQRFIDAWNAGHGIVFDDAETAHIFVGTKGWTLPIPLSKIRTGWIFDMDDAREEIRVRTIGANELATIKVMLAYTDAQQEYAAQDRNGDGVREFAQKIISSPGKQDGLYWPTADGEPESPAGPLLDTTNLKDGYHGYRFRILKAQGAAAPGGAKSYVRDGRLSEGFAAVAWPAHPGESGLMTFIVNQDGSVYQKYLGPNTADIAQAMTRFDPDASWTALPAP